MMDKPLTRESENDVADTNYFYQLQLAHGQLVHYLFKAKIGIAGLDNARSLKSLNRIARKHGFRLRIEIEPIPTSPPKAAKPKPRNNKMMDKPTTSGEKELQSLVDWIETWNRVCFAADPDDDKEPPTWAEVVAQELPDWHLGEMTADGWDAYMKQRLFHEVENYLYAVGRHPTNQAAYDKSKARHQSAEGG